MSNLSNVELIKLLPPVLQKDTFCNTLSEVFGKQMKELDEEAGKLFDFRNYEDMPEELLDYLAFQNHVDFYDVNLDIEIKREILRDNVVLHRKKGTKQAVINAASTIFGKTTLKEWFEYDGEPFGFKVDVELSNIGATQENIEKFEKLVDGYKNTRSWVETVNFSLSTTGIEYYGNTLTAEENTSILPWQITEIETKGAIQVGSAMRLLVENAIIYPRSD